MSREWCLAMTFCCVDLPFRSHTRAGWMRGAIDQRGSAMSSRCAHAPERQAKAESGSSRMAVLCRPSAREGPAKPCPRGLLKWRPAREAESALRQRPGGALQAVNSRPARACSRIAAALNVRACPLLHQLPCRSRRANSPPIDSTTVQATAPGNEGLAWLQTSVRSVHSSARPSPA